MPLGRSLEKDLKNVMPAGKHGEEPHPHPRRPMQRAQHRERPRGGRKLGMTKKSKKVAGVDARGWGGGPGVGIWARDKSGNIGRTRTCGPAKARKPLSGFLS